jgi:hypothetical protein
MKIAVCFSTQLRGGVQAHKNIKNYFEGVYEYCTFFAHLWDINTRKPYTRQGPKYFPEVMRVDDKDISTFAQLYDIKKLLVESYEEIKNIHIAQNYHFDPIYYSWYKSLKLKDEYVDSTSTHFDLVVKLRPDILFEPKRKFIKEILASFLYNPQDTFYVETLHNDWRYVDWMNDVYWVSKPAMMDVAKDFYFEQREKQKGLNQEYTLLKYLRKRRVNLVNIGYNMTCYRLECLDYDPLTEYQKCFDCDRYYLTPIELSPDITLPEVTNDKIS